MEKKRFVAFAGGEPVFIQNRKFKVLHNIDKNWNFILPEKYAKKLNTKERYTVYELTPMKALEKIQILKRAKRKWKRGERNENHNRGNA